MASRIEKAPKHPGYHPHTLARLPRAERLHRIGMLIDSHSWGKLPLAAREIYLDIVFAER